MTWACLGYEAGIEDVHPRTIQRTMGRLDYYKYIACIKGWVNKNLRTQRKEYAKIMLARYPDPED
jgi:hypothetical protein